MAYQVLLFYKYVTIEEPEVFAGKLRELAAKYSLSGRTIVAVEGINTTFEGEQAATEEFTRELLLDPRLADMHIKRSKGTGTSFPKLSIKVREEIVGTHFPPEVDPRVRTAHHLPPHELHQWYSEGRDFVVIDMRNDYEYALGRFKNSVNPGLSASRDLPEALKKLQVYKDKTVLTVCTGGVRCEKMSAYLEHAGFADVHQLDGGIHSYMEQYPGQDFLGSLYTFDQRIAMDWGGEREVVGQCRLCEASSEQYINCANDACHLHFIICSTCAGTTRPVCSPECRALLA